MRNKLGSGEDGAILTLGAGKAIGQIFGNGAGPGPIGQTLILGVRALSRQQPGSASGGGGAGGGGGGGGRPIYSPASY